MKMLVTLFSFVVLAGCSTLNPRSKSTDTKYPSDLKRIKITQSNNAPFFTESGKYTFPPFESGNLKKLRSYVEGKGFKPNKENESQFVIGALGWVSAQWDHDGLNQPPDEFTALDILKSVHTKKEKYRCVEYGIVLSELLQAYGFVSRTVALRSNDVAYGGWGKGHVAMEVWINDLEKWIFLDPQFGTYLTTNNSKMPLNFHEAFLVKNKGRWKDINVIFAAKPPEEIAKARSQYKDFLQNYFGHMTVSSGKGKPKISLFLESKTPTLVFQAHPSDDVIFTTDASLVYPEINRVSLLLNYREKDSNFNKLVQKLRIETNEDYIKSMPEFAAKPKFTVKLLNNMPSFSHYEYRVDSDSQWKKVKKDSFEWNALNEKNLIQTKAVNKMGRSGPITKMEISYK